MFNDTHLLGVKQVVCRPTHPRLLYNKNHAIILTIFGENKNKDTQLVKDFYTNNFTIMR